MNERRSSKLWAIAILVITGSVLAAAARQEGTVFAQVKPKPEKLCPITFHLDPPTSLQAHLRPASRGPTPSWRKTSSLSGTIGRSMTKN